MEESPSPQGGPIKSRSEFRDAIRRALAQASESGARHLWLMDPSFADWPLSEPDVIEHLTQWAGPHRRLTLLAGRYDDMARQHARWSEWRRHWAHVVECRSNPEIELDKVPTILLAADLICVRLLDRDHYRGTASAAASNLVRARESIDAVLQRSEEAYAVTTLGL